MNTKSNDIIMHNQVFIWIALAAGLILLIPLIAMHLTNEVNWSVGDFIIMGILLIGTGFSFVHVARVTPKKYRVLIGLAFTLTLLYLWAELAVGILTNLGT